LTYFHNSEFYLWFPILEFSGLWKKLLSPFHHPHFNLPVLRFRDTRRGTRRFQGGPHDQGRPGNLLVSLWVSRKRSTGRLNAGDEMDFSRILPEYSRVICFKENFSSLAVSLRLRYGSFEGKYTSGLSPAVVEFQSVSFNSGEIGLCNVQLHGRSSPRMHLNPVTTPVHWNTGDSLTF
jgi:hypothetical protein